MSTDLTVDSLESTKGANARKPSNVAELGLSSETIVVREEKEIAGLVHDFLERASSSFLMASSDNHVPRDSESKINTLRSMFENNSHFKFKLLTDVQKENLPYVKSLIKIGAEIRHIDKNRVNFALSKNEYLAREIHAGEEKSASGAYLHRDVIWSDSEDVVSKANLVYQNMWKMSVSSENRIRKLEGRVESVGIEVLNNPIDILEKSLAILRSAKEEIDIVLPTLGTFYREEKFGFFDELEEILAQKNIRVRILCPLDSEIETRITMRSWGRDATDTDPDKVDRSEVTFRAIDVAQTETKVTLLIVDKSRYLCLELFDDSEQNILDAIGLATYSASRPTVYSYICFFDKLWHETELKESERNSRFELERSLAKESDSRRQAELLQDVLTHDIGNYNQISRMSTEILKDMLPDDDKAAKLISKILEAIDGSSALIDRARRLGRILHEEKPQLKSVSLVRALQESLTLVKAAFPEKTVRAETSISPGISGEMKFAGEINVFADELLCEVFTNLLSNSIKYTEGKIVPLKIRISEEEKDYKISISDSGIGISENMRQRIFERYLIGAKGNGLGLSIVHALVSQRYKGRIEILKPSTGDLGTTMNIWLPRCYWKKGN